MTGVGHGGLEERGCFDLASMVVVDGTTQTHKRCKPQEDSYLMLVFEFATSDGMIISVIGL